MNFAPAISDHRDSIIMQGNENSARAGQTALQIWQWLQDRSDRKNAAIGQLTAMGSGGGGDDLGAAPAAGGGPMGGGFDPTNSGQDAAEQMDQHEANGKKADAIRNVISSYNPDPQVKSALKAKSLGELEGMLKGYAVKSAMQEHAAKMADYNAQAQLRTQQAQDDDSVGQATHRWATMPGVPTDDEEFGLTGVGTREPSADERFRYAINGMSGRAVPKFISAMANYNQIQQDSITGQKEIYPGVTALSTRKGGVQVVTDPAAKNAGENLEPVYTEDPITGSRALLYGKSAQPTGFNPAVAKSALVPQHDEEGNLVGWSQVDARGHAIWVPNKTSATLKAARDEEGNPVEGYYIDAQGRMHDTRGAMEKNFMGLVGQSTNGVPASAKPAPVNYKDQAEVVSAYKAGKLDRAAAIKLLNEKFLKTKNANR